MHEKYKKPWHKNIGCSNPACISIYFYASYVSSILQGKKCTKGLFVTETVVRVTFNTPGGGGGGVAHQQMETRNDLKQN